MLTEIVIKRERQTRLEAIATLGRIGPGAAAAVPTLIEAAAGTDHQIRLESVRALGRIGPAAKGAMRFLTKRVERSQPFDLQAAVALVRVEPNARATVKRHANKNMQMYQHSSYWSRIFLDALGERSTDTNNYIRIIINNLEYDVSSDSQEKLGDWLGRIRLDLDELAEFRTGSKPAIPSLLRLRNHPHPIVRLWIRESITSIAKGVAPPRSGDD